MSRLSRAAALSLVALLLLNACSDQADDAPAPTSTATAEADPPAGGDQRKGEEREGGEENDEAAEDEEGVKPIRMDAAAMQAAGIRLATVEPAALSEELRAPGEVVDNSYGTTLITPRVEALVVQRHAKLGDEVARGAPLVTLSSVDVAQAQGALRMAEQDWERVKALGREAVSGRRYSEAQVAVEQARAAARAYGIAGSSAGQANGEFTLSAPHAGRITEDEFVVGERIEPGTTLFRLVDESVVWIDAKLTSGLVPRVTPGTPATIVFNGERLNGTVQRAAHRTSDITRNAIVRIEVVNTGDRLHGGDFVDVFFEATHASNADSVDTLQIAVPTDALVQLQGETVVFRHDDTGLLDPVPVRTGEVIGDRTLIREGIRAGDVVVVEGAFVVKSQMLKSQLGEDE